MANVKFQAPNPYSQQAADLNRRQKMAEMLQQQSMEPLQQQSAGGMVIPLNPLAGLAKVLQSYTSSRQLSDLDKKRAGLEAQDIKSAQEMMAQFRNSATEQPIAEGDNTLRELAVRPMAQSAGVKPVIRSQLMKAGLAPGSEDYEAASAPARLNELVSPAVSLAERQQNLLPSAMGAGVGPLQQKLAQMLYEKSEAIAPLFSVGKQNEYTDDSVIMAQEAQQKGDPNPRRFLVAKQIEPKTLPESTIFRVMRERDALPKDDPNRKILDAYISNQIKSGQGNSKYSKGDVVALSDGRIVMSIFDPETGKYFYQTATGRKEVPSDARPTTAGVAAPLSQRQFIEYRKLINEDKNSINRLDTYFKNVKDMNVGYTKYADMISANAKNFFAKELSPKELAVQLAKGQVQGLVGLFRTQIVGPGVVTEQDAQRIMSALGGDPSKLQNPVIVEQLLRDLYESKKSNIEFLERELSRSNPYYNAPPATPIPPFGEDVNNEVPPGFVIESQ